MSFIKHRLRSAGVSGSSRLGTERLLGIDCTSPSAATSISRADGVSYFTNSEQPGMLNMIRDAVGRVRRRPGYAGFTKPDAITDIYAVFKHEYRGRTRFFFVTNRLICIAYEQAYNVDRCFEILAGFTRCYGFQAGKYMFISDSYRMYVYDCELEYDMYFGIKEYSSIIEPTLCYLPTTYIAGLPDGSASAYQSANRLNPFVAEQYIADGESTGYTVHFPLDYVYNAYIKDESGQWVLTEKPEKDGQTVRFSEPPPKGTLRGEDNLRIVYRRPLSTFNCGVISGCTCGTMFGVGGLEDRLFVSGHETMPGYVYYSELNEPTYFPETNYIKVGSESTKVCALCGQGVNLYVICNDGIYSITGKAQTDNPGTDYVENSAFGIDTVLTTPKPVLCTPVIFDNEINYLTEDGVCALTASGVLDERCAQIRSAYINKFLLRENLKNMEMITYKDYLILSNREDKLYILDGKQFSVSADKPFSHRQYEGYIWSGITAKSIWTYRDNLFFSDGMQVYRFDYDKFCDERGGKQIPINAYWETPEIYCDDFSKSKFFTRLGLIIGTSHDSTGARLSTDVKISAKFDGDDYRTVKDYDGKRRRFEYAGFDFSRFTYRNRGDDLSMYIRPLHKKARSIKLRFENDKTAEPFVLGGYQIEYLVM